MPGVPRSPPCCGPRGGRWPRRRRRGPRPVARDAPPGGPATTGRKSPAAMEVRTPFALARPTVTRTGPPPSRRRPRPPCAWRNPSAPAPRPRSPSRAGAAGGNAPRSSVRRSRPRGRPGTFACVRPGRGGRPPSSAADRPPTGRGRPAPAGPDGGVPAPGRPVAIAPAAAAARSSRAPAGHPTVPSRAPDERGRALPPATHPAPTGAPPMVPTNPVRHPFGRRQSDICHQSDKSSRPGLPSSGRSTSTTAHLFRRRKRPFGQGTVPSVRHARQGPADRGGGMVDRVIGDVDETLCALVREALNGSDVEVVLEAPTREWAARRSGRRSTSTCTTSGRDLRRRVARRAEDLRLDRPGRLARRLPARWFKLSYLLTAGPNAPQDEHRLPLDVARLLPAPRPPAAPSTDRAAARQPGNTAIPLGVGLPPPEDRSFADVWSALGGELKPSLDLVVSAPVSAGQSHGLPLHSSRRRRCSPPEGPAAGRPTNVAPTTDRAPPARRHRRTSGSGRAGQAAASSHARGKLADG